MQQRLIDLFAYCLLSGKIWTLFLLPAVIPAIGICWISMKVIEQWNTIME